MMMVARQPRRTNTAAVAVDGQNREERQRQDAALARRDPENLVSFLVLISRETMAV